MLVDGDEHYLDLEMHDDHVTEKMSLSHATAYLDHAVKKALKKRLSDIEYDKNAAR